MSYLFWIAFAVYIVCVFYTVFIRKQFFTSATYICVGVCVPLLLYMFRWSDLITKEPTWQFYLIFIMLFICSGVSICINKRPISVQRKYEIKMNETTIEFLNIFWIAAVLLENLLGTGMLFPALNGIDGHLRQVPLLLYITRATYAIVAIDIICFFLKQKRRYFLWAGVHLLLPIISASSRMMSVTMVLQGGSLFAFLWLNGYGIKRGTTMRKKRKIRLRHVMLVVLFAGCGIYFLVNIGIERMNHYGLYMLRYSDGIKYTGPLGEVGAWLYGYFALSFDNLNMSILAKKDAMNLIGLFSYPSFYFGLLQFDNLFGIPSHLAQISCVYKVKAAMVPTGFWPFYYDYNILCFIPMIMAFVQEYVFKLKARKRRSKLAWIALYFYFVPSWFLMSFTNTVFDVTAITTYIITYALTKRLVHEDDN